jgi:type I restriction enzyme, S subunit
MVEIVVRPLIDLCDPERGITYGIVKVGEFVSDGVPVIRGGDIRDGRVRFDDAKRVSSEVSNQFRRTILRGGEIVINLIAEPGHCAIVPVELAGANVSRDVAVIALCQDVDHRFVDYVLKSPQAIEWLSARLNGSVTQKINLGTLRELPVPCPPIAEQRAISGIIGALDDKIDLNRRMNETLEAMARAIFKDWFVDFGPTRAKMEGRAPYLAPKIWALFPDRLDDAGKPGDWISSTIGQEVDVVGGSTPSTRELNFWGGDIAWATPKDLSSLSTPVLLSTERQITDAGLLQIGSGLLPVGTVLLSSRAPIGYMAIAQIPCAVNQGFIAMVCRKRLSKIFVWLWTQANMDKVLQNANGSTFQEISKANFRPIPVAVAQPDILRLFDEMAGALFDRIVSNDKENRSLAAMRDLLLPKLLSGKIQLGDAEKALEAVA